MKVSLYNRIEFKDRAGHRLNGVVLGITHHTLLVGVQNASKPYVWSYGKKVPNNAMWQVPVADVLTVSDHRYSSDANSDSA